MPQQPILPEFAFDDRISRYRDLTTGRFVASRAIDDLITRYTTGLEQRLAAITRDVYDGELLPSEGIYAMHLDLQRAHYSFRALGAGGFDKLTTPDFVSIGAVLRVDDERVVIMMLALIGGGISLAQALTRVTGYAGQAKLEFYQAERAALVAGGERWEERRTLGISEHCIDCLEYAAMEWQPLGILPLPGENSECGVYCKCSLERRVAQGVAEAA